MSSKDKKLDFSLVLASSVHDMKNSLGMLLSSLEGVINDNPPQDEEQAKRFATLQYESSRINGELIQLLSIYRMENNRMPLNIDENYLSDTLEDQLARNDMLFKTRNIEVTLNCDEDLNWYYDNELLGGVIHNVLVNCSRYAKEKLMLSAEMIDDILCISVADDGNGYPAFMIRAPEETNAGIDFVSGSTNLGLFFANEVAKMHCQKDICGHICMENGGPYGGGVFKIYIP